MALGGNLNPTPLPISPTDLLVYAGLPVAVLVIVAVVIILVHEWRNTSTVPGPNPDHL